MNDNNKNGKSPSIISIFDVLSNISFGNICMYLRKYEPGDFVYHNRQPSTSGDAHGSFD